MSPLELNMDLRLCSITFHPHGGADGPQAARVEVQLTSVCVPVRTVGRLLSYFGAYRALFFATLSDLRYDEALCCSLSGNRGRFIADVVSRHANLQDDCPYVNLVFVD